MLDPNDLPMLTPPGVNYSCGNHHYRGYCDCNVPMYQMQSTSFINQGWSQYSGAQSVLNVKVDPRDVGGGYRLIEDINDIPMYLMAKYEVTRDINDIPMHLLEKIPPDPPKDDYESATFSPPTTSVQATDWYTLDNEDEKDFNSKVEEVDNAKPEFSPIYTHGYDSDEDEGTTSEISSVFNEPAGYICDNDEVLTCEEEVVESLKNIEDEKFIIKEPHEGSPPCLEFVYPQDISTWSTIKDDPFGQDPPKRVNLLLYAALGGESVFDSRVGFVFFMFMKKILFVILYTTRGVNDWLTLLIRGTFSTDFICRPISVGEDDPTRNC